MNPSKISALLLLRNKLNRLGNPSWLQEGTHPDYRFTLANERTFLAWIRTSLAIIAAAVLLHQLAPVSSSKTLHTFVPAVLIAFAGIIAVSAYLRWKSYEIAMRHGRALPAGAGFVSIALFSLMIAGLVVAAIWSET